MWVVAKPENVGAGNWKNQSQVKNTWVELFVWRQAEQPADIVASVGLEKVGYSLLAAVGAAMLSLDKAIGVNHRIDERERVVAGRMLSLEVTDESLAA